MAHYGQSYQLEFPAYLCRGDYVRVNGPYDMYGQVQDTIEERGSKSLFLVRGRGFEKPYTTVHPLKRR